MSTALRAHLLLLLTLPALLVPRGLELGWCLCEFALRAGCCAPAEVSGPIASCCEDEEADDAVPRAESSGALDCPGCRSIELEDFEEFLVASPAPELVAAGPSRTPTTPEVSVAEGRGSSFALLRAPPGVVPPPGLLPGALPLRI